MPHTGPKQAPSKFLCRAPQDAPAVRVGFVSPAVGYGLFAARDFAQDEFIFHEAPLMTALFNEKFSADKALMQSQVSAYRSALAVDREATALTFPMLAAQFGIAPASYEQAADILASPSHLGRNLVHGQFAGSTITREQYDSYTAGIATNNQPSEADARSACLDFFKAYAFDVRLGSRTGPAPFAAATTHEACIYLLGSLINHCCTSTSSSSSSSYVPSKHPKPKSKSTITLTKTTSNTSSSNKSTTATNTPDVILPPLPGPGPNCSWRIGSSGLAHFVKPRHICVQARRPIRAGEQLTWDYGKREKGFDCACETCRDGRWWLAGMGGLGYYCGVL